MNYCLRQVPPATLDMENSSLVDCLHTLIMARSNEVTVDGFEMEELGMSITYIAFIHNMNRVYHYVYDFNTYINNQNHVFKKYTYLSWWL